LIKKNSKDDDEKVIIRDKSHELQWLIYKWKNNQARSLYFSESSQAFFVPSIGRLLKLSSSLLDQTYYKIKNLDKLLSNQGICSKMSLKQTKDIHISQSILPLTMKRTVCVNFNRDHSLNIDLYDTENDNLLKTMKVFDHISYFPLSCAHGEYFCVAFDSQNNSLDHHNK